MSATLTAALAYAARGWRVIPGWWLHQVAGVSICACADGSACDSPGKHPLIRGWQDAATTDPAQIRRWWEKRPSARVCIATGARSGLVVLDIDPRHGGDHTLATLEREHGILPDTPRVLTPGGGVHYYFRHPGHYVPSRTIAPGVDVKGDGGLVVAPPALP